MSSNTTTVWPPEVLTLAIDVGGTGLKAAILDAQGQMQTERTKIATPYPCPPPLLVESLVGLTAPLGEFHRVSVGFPGLVREGRVIEVPSLSRSVYGGATDPQLRGMWHGFDLATALADAYKVPVKVANDADVQGCAVAQGTGFEFVMTLGTGVGTALFNEGRLLPHMELSHAPFLKGLTFDLALGNAARKEIGTKKWVKRVHKAISAFDDFLFFDHLYIGGGNAKFLITEPLGPKAEIVSNTAGILGGIRIWDLEK
ncbi:MAG: ROK family protein [Actinobacteria bacterium]|nr:ROK family protein [Actinomycetota bacterium]